MKENPIMIAQEVSRGSVSVESVIKAVALERLESHLRLYEYLEPDEIQEYVLSLREKPLGFFLRPIQVLAGEAIHSITSLPTIPPDDTPDPVQEVLEIIHAQGSEMGVTRESLGQIILQCERLKREGRDSEHVDFTLGRVIATMIDGRVMEVLSAHDELPQTRQELVQILREVKNAVMQMTGLRSFEEN